MPLPKKTKLNSERKKRISDRSRSSASNCFVRKNTKQADSCLLEATAIRPEPENCFPSLANLDAVQPFSGSVIPVFKTYSRKSTCTTAIQSVEKNSIRLNSHSETALNSSDGNGETIVPTTNAKRKYPDEIPDSNMFTLKKRKKSATICLEYTEEQGFTMGRRLNSGKESCHSISAVYEDWELRKLDTAGLPDPISKEDITNITEQIHMAVHENIVVCVVCDEFFPLSRTKLLKENELPASFFRVLRKPSGQDGSAPTLPKELLEQYDISGFFPHNHEFCGLLLSPRGLLISHENNCEGNSDSCCPLKLFVCEANRCLQALKRGTIPKFAIAQGNYVGQLPTELKDLTIASRSLIRPVQSHGRLAAFLNNGGYRITGHVYSNKLNTALVREKLPLLPEDAPLRVLVTSPFASDRSTVLRAKVARIKEEYVIQREKIAQVLQYFRNVGNPIMKAVEIDHIALNQLPNEDISPQMIFVDKDKAVHEGDGTNDCDILQCSNTPLNDFTGGPSLSRTHQENENAIFVSHTVTVGTMRPDDTNAHEQVVNVLNSSGQGGESSQNEEGTFRSIGEPAVTLATGSSNTYIVRPAVNFASDSDPSYLELHYPDLFPHGRGGFGEKREIKISRKALVRHLLNLSTRQFQEVDFVLPVYDMTVNEDMKRISFVRSILASENKGGNGTKTTLGETFGRIAYHDLKLASDYKMACGKAAREGRPFPSPPCSLNGVANRFFTEIAIASKPMQHSQAAATSFRQQVYAAHNSNGKAHIWFTFSPDDAQSFKVVWYALGSELAHSYENQAPSGEFRFKVLAKHPVAAALHFERILNIVVEKVIGWDINSQRPFKTGGLFGVPKAWLRVVEEQSRLTLHAHFLIWLYGFSDIEKQICKLMASEVCVHLDEENMSDCVPQQSMGSVDNQGIETPQNKEIERAQHENREIDILLAKLAANIDSFITGELTLPTNEMEMICRCPNSECGGNLELSSYDKLYKLRKRPTSNENAEDNALKCFRCDSVYSVSERIAAALDHGYLRCFGRRRLDEEETVDLIWKGLPIRPETNEHNETDRWLLNLCSIQVLVNMHDRLHRKSCFKAGSSSSCRYKTPHEPAQKTQVIPIYTKGSRMENSDTQNNHIENEIEKLHFAVKKRAVFMFLTDCNSSVLSVLNCNNCTRYVQDQKISLYYGAYASKHNGENEKSLVDLMTALSKYEKKIENNRTSAHDETEHAAESSNEPRPSLVRSPASIGLGRLLSGARAATNGETVGAPLASFAARGNPIFLMSHQTAVLPLTQALAYLTGEPLRSSINRNGIVLATIYDYVFRSQDNDTISTMTYWNFVATIETASLKANSPRKQGAGSSTESLSDSEDNASDDDKKNDDTHWNYSRPIYVFQSGHPQKNTHGLRKRKHPRWPRYTAKRLPNAKHLEDDDQECSVERHAQRETYAQGVLIMFFPFRQLSDLLDIGSSWWHSYLRRRTSILANPGSVQALNSMQNFYESFCSNETFQDGENLVDDHDQQLEPVPDYDEDHDNTDFNEDVLELQQHDDVTFMTNLLKDPFVSRLAALSEMPIKLQANACVGTVNMEEAAEALRQLPDPSGKRETFVLPGRTLTVSAISPSQENPTNSHEGSNLTRVQLLENIQKALEKRSTYRIMADGTEPMQNISKYPTLEEQSVHWNLNRKQHMAFILLGTALLQYISVCETNVSSDFPSRIVRLKTNIDQLCSEILPHSQQLVMHLGGSGGTGKSRVIQAFVDFAKRWESSSAVVICASSGIAAMLIGGCTLHSALGIQRSLHPRDPSPTQIAAWSEVGIVFVDEFSMIQAGLFDLLESRLRKLKTRLDKPFGGVHMILSGDFYQLPPVGVSVYRLPTYKESERDTNNLASMRGYHLWQTCLTDVIILDENLRQTDKQWAEALQRWRTNQPTQNDIDAINSRLLANNCDSSNHLSPPPPGTRAAVSDNKYRENGLRFCEITMCSTLPPITDSTQSWRVRGVLIIKAKITQASGHQAVRPEQDSYIRQLGTKRLGGEGNLYCVTNAPYIVTNNEDVSKGISNGTIAILKDIILKPHAQVHLTPVHGHDVHTVYADDIDCLVLQHTVQSWKTISAFSSLPAGFFPLRPISKKVKCPLGKSGETFTVNVSLLPCELALVLTGHKVQGQTMDSIIMGPMSKHHNNGQSGWIYVVLSRVTSLTGLFLTTPLQNNVRKYKPRNDVAIEMQRLMRIETETVARLNRITTRMTSS